MFESTLTIVSQLLDASWLLADTPLLSKWLGWISVGLQVAAGLGFVIFVHELGHFLAAKTFGVKCEKFYVGFDVPISIGPIRLPRTLGRFRWGETEYGIGIIPLGGYVKMLGQDDDPRKAEEETERSRIGEGPTAQLDPRSYQAKPVWQRMIIISAGVVMNVIFAVFLAAGAFLYGVPYMPTIIGSSPLGAPAWQAGLQPGDHIVQMANMDEDDPYLRFDDMAGKTIFHGMRHKDAPIPFTVVRDGNRTTVNVRPSNKLHRDGSFYFAGINPATIAELSDPKPIASYSYLASRNIDLQPGDRIVAVDGERLPVNEAAGKILSIPLTDAFQAKWDKPVELTIMRREQSAGSNPGKNAAAGTGSSAQEREVKVTLPPVPVKSLGLGFAMGKISAIRAGSLAEAAGIQVGDIIESVDGEAVVDALRLPMDVAEKNGQPIEFQVRRSGSDKPLTITMTNTERPAFGTIGDYSAQWGLESYGIAYEVSPKVSYIDPASEKASSSVKVGDELTQLKLELTPEQIAEYSNNGKVVSEKIEVVSSLSTIPFYFAWMQHLPPDVNVRCYLKRNEQVREVVLPLREVDDWFWIQRGILLKPLEKIQETDQLGQAMSWGVVETGRRLRDVFDFLTILVTGRASPRNLAGPFGIAEVAAHEASTSPSRLLLFLTLLSANLAILNFLPIPALDGGHLMFLIAEAIRGKPLNEALQIRLTMAGVVCLLGLMAFAILNDILRKVM